MVCSKSIVLLVKLYQIENVHFTESNGTSDVINNPVGVVQLDLCTFSHIFYLVSRHMHDHEGGGGFVIETNSASLLLILLCISHGNNITIDGLILTKHYAHGQGCGITMNLVASEFVSNTALHGGSQAQLTFGLYVMGYLTSTLNKNIAHNLLEMHC